MEETLRDCLARISERMMTLSQEDDAKTLMDIAMVFHETGTNDIGQLRRVLVSQTDLTSSRETQDDVAFEDWHDKIASCCENCRDRCPHKDWERAAWFAAKEHERDRIWSRQNENHRDQND
jgi:hypothetical protein